MPRPALLFLFAPLLLALSSAAPRLPRLGKVLGADISFLPQLEAQGIKFSDKGVPKDAIQILKDHHFNYIRLRIFNNQAADSGYSPGKGFCDLPHTLAMAKRVKVAGLKLLLDFHYSDTREVNDLAFNLPGGKGKGTFIWEPLNTWEAIFDKQGQANDLLPIYDEISQKYQIK